MPTTTRVATRMSRTRWSVGEVARLAGISVRTLHHYDEIGLVPPSERTAGGHRQYVASDLERLRAVLAWRELDFSLDQIAELVDGDTGAHHALQDQRDHLNERIDRLRRIVAALDHQLEATTMNINLTPGEKLEVFGDWLPEEYEQEAEKRWGGTDAWAQSRGRTSSYTKEDWLALQAVAAAIEQGLIALLDDGVEPESAAAMDLAERHRQHITDAYYDCSLEIHDGLGQMYVQDPRFTAHYDDQRAGLAQYVSDAIAANVLRQLD